MRSLRRVLAVAWIIGFGAIARSQTAPRTICWSFSGSNEPIGTEYSPGSPVTLSITALVTPGVPNATLSSAKLSIGTQTAQCNSPGGCGTIRIKDNDPFSGDVIGITANVSGTAVDILNPSGFVTVDISVGAPGTTFTLQTAYDIVPGPPAFRGAIAIYAVEGVHLFANLQSAVSCDCMAPPGEPDTMSVTFTPCPPTPQAPLFSVVWGGPACAFNQDPARPCGLGPTLTAVSGEVLSLTCQNNSIHLFYSGKGVVDRVIGWCPYVGGLDRITVGIGGWDKEARKPRCFTSAQFESRDGGVNDPDDGHAQFVDQFLSTYSTYFGLPFTGPEPLPLFDVVRFSADFREMTRSVQLRRYTYRRSGALCDIQGVCCTDQGCNRYTLENNISSQPVSEKQLKFRLKN